MISFLSFFFFIMRLYNISRTIRLSLAVILVSRINFNYNSFQVCNIHFTVVLSYAVYRGENSGWFDLKLSAESPQMSSPYSPSIRFKLGVFIETFHNRELHGVRLLRYDSRECINHSLWFAAKCWYTLNFSYVTKTGIVIPQQGE